MKTFKVNFYYDEAGYVLVKALNAQEAEEKIRKELEDAGVFSIALEMVSHEVAQIISETVSVPVIGIGSGVNCDGQVLVVQDLLGMYEKIKPKFAKRYMNLSEDIVKSLEDYIKDVESGEFPTKENSFSMNEEELKKLREQIGS